MSESTAALAQAITYSSSKQTYYTARFWVDRDLVDDFFRAYAYCRWADDVIDISSASDKERTSFIERQQEIITRCYRNERVESLSPEEQIVAELIRNDRFEKSGLQSFIRSILDIIEFDAKRKGELISQDELTWYTDRLGRGVIDGLQYFIGNGYPYPRDIANGFVNIPREYLESHKLNPDDLTHPDLIAWVRSRIKLARDKFQRGKQYINSLKVLRCKIVGQWYCARFEDVLNQVERDGYILRERYDGSKIRSFAKLGRLSLITTLLHAFSLKNGRMEARQESVNGDREMVDQKE
jgi:phytoene/squalene synthetase